ncbi:MAG: hypothetical protein IPJ25_13160 [Rhodocyclaceae bacterium]|nr:hypothetical protein [Rhodocyclaceae bacterium]
MTEANSVCSTDALAQASGSAGAAQCATNSLLRPAPTGEISLRERLFSIDEQNSRTAPDALTVGALIYLALPTLIFLAGWLRWWAAIPMLALTLVSLSQFIHRQGRHWTNPYSFGATIFIVVIAFAWASLGGAGHFFESNPDWLMRDKVLGDLTLTDWPPAYSFVDGHAHILRTALGFFLPAAVVGKLFGIASVDVALYLYCAIGCSLFLLLLPLPKKPGGLLLGLLLVTILFSGMDYLGIVLITGTTPLFPLRLEWWVPFSYSSFTGAMHWAPNHAIPLLLVSVLFYRHWGHRSWPMLFMVMLPLTVIWTPFAAAAILPFLVLASWRWFAQGNQFSDSHISFVQLLASALLTILTLRLLTLDLAAIPALPSPTAAANWNFDTDRIALKYLLFILMEFAILALLLARDLRHSHGLFWLACAILTILPLLKFGPSNDLLLRLSTPCLVVILITLIEQIAQWTKAGKIPRAGYAIALILLIGAATPFNEMYRAATFKASVPDYGRSLVEQHWDTEPPHYVGVANSAWLNSVLSAPTRVPNASERRSQGLPPAAPAAVSR